MNEQFSEREVVRLHPPTSPISTTADNNMSYSFFSDREVEVKRESRTGSEVEVNDQQFQIDTLQDSVDDLKKQNDELESENRELRKTCQDLLVKVDELRSNSDRLTNQLIHRGHQMGQLKLSVGGQMKRISKMDRGLFPREDLNTTLGYGSFLNGEEVLWRKASQKYWDEELHAPLFGHADPNCNFVLLHRSDPINRAGDTLVHAVGCHVVPNTLIKFKINEEEACFGF